MIEALLLLFCLIVVFFIKHKKLKILSIFQAVFAVFISVLVLFFLPHAPLQNFAILKMGESNFNFFQSVLIKSTFLNVSVIEIIEYAVLLLLALSVFEFIDFVKELVKIAESQKLDVADKKHCFVQNSHYFTYKIYLIFCRLLN